MKFTPVRLALVACGLLSILGCKKLVALATPQAPIVDSDYQFRLESPGRGWTLLDRQAAQKLVPDSAAGANLVGAGLKAQYGVVIVENYPGDLASYAQLIDQALQIEEKKVEARAEEQFQGRQAVRVTTRGTRGGVKLLFQHVLFLHQGFGYQLVAWGLDGQVTADGLRAFSSGFRLLEGTVKARRSKSSVTEAHGPGWIVDKGQFRSAAWGIAATPTEDARVVVGNELATMNSSAEVGLVGGTPEGYVVVLPEFVSPEVAKAIAVERQRANAEAMKLTEESGGISVNTLGEKVTLRRYTSPSQPIVYFQGAVVRGGRVFVLLAWQMKNAMLDAGGGILGKMLGSLRLLDEGEWAAAAKDVESRGPVSRQVGAGFAQYKGTYRNFDHGFTWALPAASMRIHTGDAAREQTASALVVFDQAGTGTGGMVTMDDAKGLSAGAFHSAMTAALFEGKKGRASAPRKVDLSGGSALLSEGDVVLAGVPMVERVVSWVRENKGYRAVVWGVRTSDGKMGERFDALMRGLALKTDPAISVQDGRYTNRRFGFSYAPPSGPGGKFERAELVPPEIASIGSIVEWKNSKHQVAILAIFDMESRMDEEMVLSKFRPKGGRALLTNAETGTDSLGGVVGKRIRNSGLVGRDSEVILVRRHGVYYGLLLDTLNGKANAADWEAFKAGFQFVE